MRESLFVTRIFVQFRNCVPILGKFVSFITADAIITAGPIFTQIYIIKCEYVHNATNIAVMEKLVTLLYTTVWVLMDDGVCFGVDW